MRVNEYCLERFKEALERTDFLWNCRFFQSSSEVTLECDFTGGERLFFSRPKEGERKEWTVKRPGFFEFVVPPSSELSNYLEKVVPEAYERSKREEKESEEFKNFVNTYCQPFRN